MPWYHRVVAHSRWSEPSTTLTKGRGRYELEGTKTDATPLSPTSSKHQLQAEDGDPNLSG
jgi:hypothetical protein